MQDVRSLQRRSDTDDRHRCNIGLFDLNTGACSEPETAARIARLAEDAGFDSLWAGEHVVLPDPRVPPSPMEPADAILDPIIALTFLAAQTRRVRLGTGIIILPQRNPLVLAKEIASLDVLSGGRFIFGIGVGYLEPEFRALGIPFAERGPRTDDYLAAMRAIWSEPAPAHQGRFVQFAGVQAYPRPVQQPGPPIVVGGRSPGAYRRAVRAGRGLVRFRPQSRAHRRGASPRCAKRASSTSARPPSANWKSASRRAAPSRSTTPGDMPPSACIASSSAHPPTPMPRPSSDSSAPSERRSSGGFEGTAYLPGPFPKRKG